MNNSPPEATILKASLGPRVSGTSALRTSYKPAYFARSSGATVTVFSCGVRPMRCARSFSFSRQTYSINSVRFVDDHQPAIVEVEFTDAAGQPHSLIDKVSIFTTATLRADSMYPQPGTVRCRLLRVLQ